MSLTSPHRARAGQEAKERPGIDSLSDEQISEIRHALQNPLAAISGFAELLCARRDEETQREAPRRILEAAEQLTLILEDALTLLALGSGTLVLDIQTVDLGAIVTEVLVAAESKHGRRLPMLRQKSWPRVEADSERLAQALRHLIAHACTHASGSGGSEITAQREDGFAVVSIVVVPPVNSLPLGPTGADGAGLAIARSLIALHGGVLWTKGKPGRASRIGFTVPFADGEQPA